MLLLLLLLVKLLLLLSSSSCESCGISTSEDGSDVDASLGFASLGSTLFKLSWSTWRNPCSGAIPLLSSSNKEEGLVASASFEGEEEEEEDAAAASSSSSAAVGDADADVGLIAPSGASHCDCCVSWWL